MIKLFFFSIIIISCSLRGIAQTIYVTDIPTIANIRVFETINSVQADIIVYKAPSPIYPGINQNDGIWYFTDVQTLANKIIYYTDSSVTADLIVYYTNVPTLAGWQNIEKRNMFKLEN